MGGDHHYRSLSTSDEAVPLATEKQGYVKPTGWGKQSILLSLATGTLFIAVIAAVLSTVGSAVVSYGSSGATTTTAVGATATSAAAQQTAVLNDDSMTTTDPDADIMSAANIQDCGYTADEARAKGCVFDVMMQLWTPKDCFDSPLSERFLEVGNWTWYADPGAEKIFTLEEMRKGEHDAVYVAQDYHITHCIYAWERLVRAMRNQQPLIMELISYDHVIHCRHKTLQRADHGTSIRGVRAPTGYTKCAKYDTWKYNLPLNTHSSTE